MSYSRSNVIVVIDGLLSGQLADLGQDITKLPVPPIVTLAKTVPILGTDLAEEKQSEAKQELATAKVSLNAKTSLNINAASEIIAGTNPMSAENFFRDRPFDAMIKRGSNGLPAIAIKNFGAPGMQKLAALMSSVRDLSEHKAFQQSYKGIFAKPSANGIARKQPVVISQHDVPKPKI